MRGAEAGLGRRATLAMTLASAVPGAAAAAPLAPAGNPELARWCAELAATMDLADLPSTDFVDEEGSDAWVDQVCHDYFAAVNALADQPAWCAGDVQRKATLVLRIITGLQRERVCMDQDDLALTRSLVVDVLAPADVAGTALAAAPQPAAARDRDIACLCAKLTANMDSQHEADRRGSQAQDEGELAARLHGLASSYMATVEDLAKRAASTATELTAKAAIVARMFEWLEAEDLGPEPEERGLALSLARDVVQLAGAGRLA